ncbi:MAG TPA: iron ABC transporter permease [Candidatus Cloacimonadota bacterium]|nr:iron ABC transporter permease [Candidatus Cloacimonadota bacterium]HOQ79669.1 iron ABC transporter permease [Candidatus Cloacimonadota bacterium]
MNKHFSLAILIFIALIVLYSSINYTNSYIYLNVRLPRLLLTILAGMILSGTGSVFQILLNNPLAEPYILGVSSGAALGSIIAGLVGAFILAPLFGFVGALISIIVVWALSSRNGYLDKTKLLFSGIIFGMFVSAIISFLMYIFQKDVGLILQVLMGNLGHIFYTTEWVIFLVSMAISIILLFYLYMQSNALNIMTTGDEAAQSIGVDVKKLRLRIFIVGSLLTGVSVAYAGIIGFIGLIIPHFVRLLVSSDQKKVFPLSVVYGANFLLFCDLIAFNLTVVEFPVGIITSFIGCPIFLYLLLIRRK